MVEPMRAGRTVRALRAIASAPACAKCGHLHGHYERPYGTPEYVPLMFHCSAEGCSCTVDKRGAK